MKKLISIIVCTFFLFINVNMVTAESPNPSQEEVNIKTTIETFF